MSTGLQNKEHDSRTRPAAAGPGTGNSADIARARALHEQSKAIVARSLSPRSVQFLNHMQQQGGE